jgi:NAD(P)-dependent dehydrogenase (short-subunit alcohol dehydrogenase family)
MPERKPIARAEGPKVQSKASPQPVVLVTGSTGLIGSKIVEAFAADYHVIGLDVKPPKKEMAHDLRDPLNAILSSGTASSNRRVHR